MSWDEALAAGYAEWSAHMTENAGVELDLREADMRYLRLDEPAGLVYCPFRALLHLPTWADRRRTFERVAALLRPASTVCTRRRRVYGGFAGEPFTDDSTEYVFVARFTR